VWSSNRAPTPEISATPLEVPPSTVVEVAPPPPTTTVEDVAPTVAQLPDGDELPAEPVEPPPATDVPRVRAPSVALATLSAEDAARARDCLSHNDFTCAVGIYRTSRDPHDLRRVIDALDHLGRHREALTAMRDFVRRFPRAPETGGYRAQLTAAGM